MSRTPQSGAVERRWGSHFTPALTVRTRAERAPYLHTLSSFDNPITTDMVATHLRLDHRGWLGEAGMQVERFPDSNRITGQYGWLLAPIRRAGRAQLQGGYAFERRNSDQSRFTVVPATPMFLPPDPRFMTRYAPYYTPLNLVSHSAAAALLVRAGSRVMLHVGGSFALHAAEDAPTFQIRGGIASHGDVAPRILSLEGRHLFGDFIGKRRDTFVCRRGRSDGLLRVGQG